MISPTCFGCRLATAFLVLAALVPDRLAAVSANDRGAVVERVRSDIEFLSSDALEGRGIDTKGIETAAQHILAEYAHIGLRPAMPGGSWRQSFPVAMGDAVVSPETRVILKGPEGRQIVLEMPEQFQPLQRGADGTASGALAFVGYGITAAEESYDDYAGIDVKGKIVVIIRREPQQNVANGAFEGPQTTQHAYVDRKLELAVRGGAAAVILVNDWSGAGADEKDELTPPAGFGGEGDSIPFVHVRQSVLDRLLEVSPLSAPDGSSLSSLAAVTAAIDQTLKPVSRDLAGWSAEVTTRFSVKTIRAENLIGIVDGVGPLSDETIVIGGHYDHIGYGGFGSRVPQRRGEIHNGADDNATGTAAVLEMARRIAAGEPPRRRMVFVCFSAEEKGLIGSNYYIRSPPVPLEQTVFMMNFDMIGNLRNNRVEVNGAGTAKEFAEIIRQADEQSPLETRIVPNPFAGSDHLPFVQRRIPVMFCFTGVTSTYHTPDDDFETLNIEGTVSVIDFSELILRAVDAMEARPTYQEMTRSGRTSAKSPYLGITPEFSDEDGQGVLILAVRRSSPAETAGLQAGDILVEFGETTLTDYQSLIDILAGAKPGDTVRISLKRGETVIRTSVVLASPPQTRSTQPPEKSP